MTDQVMENNEICPLKAFEITGTENIWVFGYGSLIWNPGFEYINAIPGHLCGYHRRFCLYSKSYRGTEEEPGLVLGLDRGGSCSGVLFEVEASAVKEAMAYLWEREQHPPGVYHPEKVSVLKHGSLDEKIDACTFVINSEHADYCKSKCKDSAAECIYKAKGNRGSNIEYLERTVHKLQELDIADVQLEDLLKRVKVFQKFGVD